MKKLLTILIALVLAIAAGAQTLNVQVGSVTYQFPAAQCGDMTYSDGTTLTVMGKAFTISDITAMSVDETAVTDSTVTVAFGTSPTVTVAGNAAKYVAVTVTGTQVSITQSNTSADNIEISYILSGEASGAYSDGLFYLGSADENNEYKATVQFAGLTLTNTSGPAVCINNGKRIKVSSKKNTTNKLTGVGTKTYKGALYVNGHGEFQGNGSLYVNSTGYHGIKTGDYMTVKNCSIYVQSAAKDGVSCNEYFQMKSGYLEISGSSDDGIQCEIDSSTGTATAATDDEHSDEDTGSIYIDGGTLVVTTTETATKCVKGDGNIVVSGGTVTLTAQGAVDNSDPSDLSYAAGFKADGNFTQSGGNITITVTGASGRGIGVDGTFTTTASSTGTLTITNSGALTSSGTSYFATAKGVKAGVVAINGGTIDVTMSGAAAKGIKSDSDDGAGDMTITGGTITVTTSGSGAYDGTDSDAKGAGGLKADNNMTISGGTLTLKSTGSGGKCIKADNVLTITDGTITATTTGSKYTYSSDVTASPKAIKAGTKTASTTATTRAGGGPGGNPGGNQGGPGGGGGGDDSSNYTYSGGMVISGGTITASSSNHEAIESKNTLDISGGNIYAYSSDDAMNSASHFTITGGNVMGYSSGNDGLDANGNFYIKGGNVVAIGTRSPEVAIDANTEGGYKLYITGGNVVAVAGLESGSSLSGVTSKSTSVSTNTWYTFKNGSTSVFSFKTPSSLSNTSTTIVASSTPTISSGSISGTTIWNGYGVVSQ